MNEYVHGYSPRETQRLQEQSQILEELLHSDTFYPAGSKVLEAGCGVGGQTVILAKNNPDADFTSIDISEDSLNEAKAQIEDKGFPNVCFQQADLMNLPFDDDLFALAYLKKGETDKAIAEYERITTLNLEIGLDRPLIHPMSRYRLARLYEETGQREKAIEQYEEALAIWSNAEEGLFEVEDARKKLETLKAKTSKK